MLDNITGPGRIASAALIKDLKALCRLGNEPLSRIAEAFQNITLELGDSDTQQLASALKSLRVDPGVLQPSLNAARYVWTRWARQNLTKDQVLSDFRSLELKEEELKNVIPLLNVMESRVGAVRHKNQESTALNTGAPLIRTCSYAIDARTIFRGSEFQEKLGDRQPFYEVDFFMPVLILEIVSELNNEKETNSFILDEKELDDMITILSRAKKQLKVVKDCVSTWPAERTT